MTTPPARQSGNLAFALFAAATMTLALFFVRTAFAGNEDRLAALRAAELARFVANDDADAGVLGRLLDDELEYVHSNGDVDTKRSFIDSLVSGRRDYVKSQPVIDSIRILGDVAIIRGTARVTVADNGRSLDLDLGYTDIWIWKDQRWQMTAWRSARMPPASR
jgi:hypothetical protein